MVGRPPSLILHVGVPKSATTTVQSALAGARDDLALVGVTYPSRNDSHVAAMRAPLGWPATSTERRADRRRWRHLVEEVRRCDSRVVISAESLAAAGVDHARAILEALGRDDVTVIVTLRSLSAILPSAWQEDVKAGLSVPFTGWLDDVLRGPNAPKPSVFWAVHDHPAVVERWATAVGLDRVQVVIVDSARPGDVLCRFEELLGVSAGTLVPSGERRNRSLTAAESELVRRLNEHRGVPVTPGELRQRPLPRRAIERLLERPVAHDEPRLVLPEACWDRVATLSDAAVAGIATSGVRVVGDLDVLRPMPATPVVDPPEPPDAIPVEAGIALITGLLDAAT